MRMRQHRVNLRQRDTECAAAPMLRFQRDVAAIGLNRPFRNGQAQASSAVIAGSRLIDPVEAIKYARLKLFRNSGAVVADLQDGVVNLLVYADRDSCTFRTVLDGVVHEVKNSLPQNQTIADPCWLSFDVDAERLIFLVGKNVQLLHHL